MKEKASRKLANGQNIDYSEKENGPRASSASALGLNTIIFKHVYWYMLQISGERLQDHWSSGFIFSCKFFSCPPDDVVKLMIFYRDVNENSNDRIFLFHSNIPISFEYSNAFSGFKYLHYFPANIILKLYVFKGRLKDQI